MAKLMCKQCGGKVKMAKMSKGGFAAGIPYASGAGATDGKNGMMKKGGTHKMPNGKIMLNSKMQKGGTTIKKEADANFPLSRKTLKTIGLYKPLEYLSEKVATPIAKYFGVKQVRTFGGNAIKSKNQLKVNANKVKVNANKVKVNAKKQ